MKTVQKMGLLLALLCLTGCAAENTDSGLLNLTVTPEEFRSTSVSPTSGTETPPSDCTESVVSKSQIPAVIKEAEACDFSAAEAIYEGYLRQEIQTDEKGRIWYPDSAYVDDQDGRIYYNVKRLPVYEESSDTAYGYYDNGDVAFVVEGAGGESPQTTLYAYGYDEEGRQVLRAWREPGESLVRFCYWDYDEQGHVVREYRYPVEDEAEDKVALTNYRLNYSADGSYFYRTAVTEEGHREYYFYANGSASREAAFDSEGNVTAERRWDEAGRLTYLYEEDPETKDTNCLQYTYDSAGNYLSKNKYNNGMLLSETQYAYEYDENGQILSMEVYVEETLAESYEYRYASDENGRLVEIWMIDGDGAAEVVMSRVYRFE